MWQVRFAIRRRWLTNIWKMNQIYKMGVNRVDSMLTGGEGEWRAGVDGGLGSRGRQALAISSIGKQSRAFLITSQWNHHWEGRLISCLALL